MKYTDYRCTGEVKLDAYPTGLGKAKVDKDELVAQTEKNLEKIEQLQEMLYADGRESLIVVLQAMDAAGKDSTIKHVLSAVNPQGVDVYSFKSPSSDELSRDFLWRVNKCVPARGKIAIFNRSHYEDVLVVKVHKLQKTYHIAQRCIGDDFFQNRYKAIKHYEEYLYENGCRMIKIFLHVSKDTQKKRFLERIEDKSKNWKFSSGDIKERELWDKYQSAYEDAISATATEHCPWYVIPADKKWFTRYLVSEVVLDVLKRIDPKYPELPDDEREKMEACRQALNEEES